MSLLNDLNPDVRQLLDADKEQYPSTVKSIINDLQSAYFVGDISVNTASNLLSYADKVGMKFDNHIAESFVLKLYKIFGK
jgi:predicted DsbA family dithiol-disulfide isomerase